MKLIKMDERLRESRAEPGLIDSFRRMNQKALRLFYEAGK
jgi:hypothetical protein